MEIVKRTKVRKNTWLGREGEAFTVHLDKQRTGLRISVIKWLDTNEGEVRFIKGDGRKAGFKEFENVTVPASEIESTVDRMVGEA